MTKDEALRVAREALTDEEIKALCASAGIKWIEPDDDPDGFPGSFDVVTMPEMRALLRTIALAVEAPSDGVEVDRDSDGELLIDWSPGEGRMVSMTLRDDGRLSYAFTWDGEQAHGAAQMPPAVQSVALAGGWGELREGRDFDHASASGAVGETAPTREQIMEQAVRWHDENTLGGPDCEHRQLEMLAYVEGYSAALAAGLPGTSNGQENGNG